MDDQDSEAIDLARFKELRRLVWELGPGRIRFEVDSLARRWGTTVESARGTLRRLHDAGLLAELQDWG